MERHSSFYEGIFTFAYLNGPPKEKNRTLASNIIEITWRITRQTCLVLVSIIFKSQPTQTESVFIPSQASRKSLFILITSLNWKLILFKCTNKSVHIYILFFYGVLLLFLYQHAGIFLGSLFLKTTQYHVISVFQSMCLNLKKYFLPFVFLIKIMSQHPI